MASLTECIFVLKRPMLSFALKTDVPMTNVVVWAMQGDKEICERFDVLDTNVQYVSSFHLRSIIPDTIRFLINFPSGASDSCGTSVFSEGRVHDCMAPMPRLISMDNTTAYGASLRIF